MTPVQLTTTVGRSRGGIGRVTTLKRRLESAGVACELALPGGEVLRCGTAAPEFTLSFRTPAALRTAPNEYALGRAYVDGIIDFEGDPLALLRARGALGMGRALWQKLAFAGQLFITRPTNAHTIAEHYTLGDDFYLAFIDRRYRFYSHCVFKNEDDTLEQAAEHKLDQMWDALGLQPGMRLLDIGGGWGGVTEYCGARGVEVTSLTLVEDSANYIRRLIAEKGLEGRVLVGDFLDHKPDEPYDHAVIYGVIEHIPRYRRFCERLWDALEPGGRLYLDASATTRKYAISPFTRRYTWTGTHAFLGLQNMIDELLLHGFELVQVRRETRDYELTITEWAKRLDAARDELVARWGEPLYRAFRVYLWGGAHAFDTNRLQAYHLVAERRAEPGPRPIAPERFAGFLASLR